MAGRIYQKDHPEMGDPTGYDTYQPAQRQSIAMHFDLAPGVSLARNFSGLLVDQSTKALTYDRLSDEIKQKVAEDLALVQRYMANVHMVQSGRGRRTPPP